MKFLALDLNQRKDLQTALHLTGPRVFVEGKEFADLATLKTLHETEALAKSLPASCVVETLEQRLKKLVNQSRVMLFMKGSPKQPSCGFSQRIVNLLN